MTRIILASLCRTSLLVVALALTALPAWSQAIHEIEVNPATLDWHVVAPDGTAFATFNVGGTAFYAVSDDFGLSTKAVRRQQPEMRLHYGNFDPAKGTPEIPPALQANEQARLFLVQYETQGLEAYRRTLSDMGAEVLQFMPWQANLVRMSPSLRAQVQNLDFVRWVGAYHPAYKTDVHTLFELSQGSLATKRWHIHVTKKGLAEKNEIALFISQIGGEVHDYVSPHGYLIDAVLTPSQFVQILKRDNVLFADAWSAPEDDLDIARDLGGADYVEALEGYSGQGVRAEVQDSGLFTGHPDFVTPSLIHTGNSGSTSHGTSVYGIVFGTGNNNPAARGFLPDAQPVFSSYSNIVDRYVETGELLSAPYRCVFQTNSWGSARTFFYTTVSADIDNILFDHDVVVLQSQSNAGNQDSRPQAWAKNIVSVGGIRHMNTRTITDDNWSNGASIGPADDGRIKPDVSAFYDSTLSASSSGTYSNFGGTSGATPITAGHMGLIHQMWADGLFRNPLTSWDVFDNKPHATTAKALLINSAAQYAFSGTGDDLTRVHQGWGRPSVKGLYNRAPRLRYIDQSIVLPPLGSTMSSYTVAAGEGQFRATLVYADPAGSPSAAIHRINDLTLKVTDPSGTVYWGNNGLLANNFSTSGGSSNMIDTVEQVLIDAPMAGTWLVEVIASEINQDGHLETPALDADFSLVVSGVDAGGILPPDSGQANRAEATLAFRDSLNLNGQKPKNGVNGPFFADLSPGGVLEFTVSGEPNKAFQLFLGPLGRTNEVFPGDIGNLDVGLVGPGVYNDIQLIINGLTPVSLIDATANTGASGEKTYSFSLPPFVLGTLGTFQAAIFDPVPADIRLTAATEVSVN